MCEREKEEERERERGRVTRVGSAGRQMVACNGVRARMYVDRRASHSRGDGARRRSQLMGEMVVEPDVCLTSSGTGYGDAIRSNVT